MNGLKNINRFDDAFWEMLDSLVKDSEIVIMCIVDCLKRDSEIKILIGCMEEEKELVYRAHNETQNMKGIMIRR